MTEEPKTEFEAMIDTINTANETIFAVIDTLANEIPTKGDKEVRLVTAASVGIKSLINIYTTMAHALVLSAHSQNVMAEATRDDFVAAVETEADKRASEIVKAKTNRSFIGKKT